MKKRTALITAILLVLSTLCAIAVSAVDTAATPTVPIVKDRLYYAYFNSKTSKGAISFCLDNKFTAFGKTGDNISLCTKNADGTYSEIYSIDKSAVDVWFSGTTDLKLQTSENISSLLGGLSGLGITADMEKTNIALNLTGQSIEKDKEYYIYIPAYYFLDANGNGNAGGYIPVEKEKINSYAGDLFSDLQNAADEVYDLAIRGYETIAGLIGR